jgi:hypothetical protein
VVEHLPSKHEAMHSITNTEKKNPTILRKMQIKTTMRYNLISFRMAIFFKVLLRMWRKRNSYTLLVGM